MLQEGDKIKITYLKPCINAPYTKNPYIGMQGEVRDLTTKYFSLYTDNSWLVGIKKGVLNVRYKYV